MITLVDEFPDNTRQNVCCGCGAARRTEDRLVNLNIFIEFEGWLILCETCIREIMHTLGYATSDLVAKFDQERERLKAFAVASDQKLEAIRRLL